jgi:hypothetical protein
MASGAQLLEQSAIQALNRLQKPLASQKALNETLSRLNSRAAACYGLIIGAGAGVAVYFVFPLTFWVWTIAPAGVGCLYAFFVFVSRSREMSALRGDLAAVTIYFEGKWNEKSNFICEKIRDLNGKDLKSITDIGTVVAFNQRHEEGARAQLGNIFAKQFDDEKFTVNKKLISKVQSCATWKIEDPAIKELLTRAAVAAERVLFGKTLGYKNSVHSYVEVTYTAASDTLYAKPWNEEAQDTDTERTEADEQNLAKNVLSL